MSSALFILPIMIGLVYLTIFAGVLYLIYTWVTKFIRLKQDHNDLLSEIIKKNGSSNGWNVKPQRITTPDG